MYQSFYKLRKKPFSLLPDPAFLYISGKHRKTLAKLRSGILNRAGTTVVTGKIGSGKTTLIQHLRFMPRVRCFWRTQPRSLTYPG